MMQVTTEVPTATPVPQWRKALDKGNSVRMERAEYKRELRAGKHTARSLLLDPPEVAHDVSVWEVLTWLPGIKRKRALRILNGIVFSEGMTLGRLSLKTRMRIYERVEHYQPTYGRFQAAHYGEAA